MTIVSFARWMRKTPRTPAMNDEEIIPNDRPTLIEHLSNEIDSHTQALMDFRTKINFTLYVGPFIVLGTYLVARKDAPLQFRFGWPVVLLILCWFAMSIAAARFEAHIWDQCNRWRELIFKLQSPVPQPVKKSEIIFKHSVVRSYIITHSILLAAVVAAVYILLNVA